MKSRSDRHLPVETEQVYRNVDGTVAVERITRDAPPVERRRRPERRPSLAGLLVAGGFTSYEQITEALEEGLGTGERLGEVIIRRGWATQEDLAELLATQWTLPYLDSASLELDMRAVGELSLELARELEAIPLHRDNGRLVVAFAEPTDERFARLRELLGEDVTFAVVARSVLDSLLADPRPRLVEVVSPPPPVDAETSPLTERLSELLDEATRLETVAQRAEAELETAHDQRRRDEETIAELRATLKLRDDLLDALRAKLAEA